ncbi:hypothetical protein [Agrobacterium larrymoorei]|uniref:Uncharacterized protein n=1 Tax=Agrobacterium larrymoorei TaxID=160699 RepID=A0ABU0UQI1_9HYPH|nr:hypothetical protein [Agrobacterium larrymoorei]MDQ1187008.1 hypothetical protein [Agrobacterium larrymoorei]
MLRQWMNNAAFAPEGHTDWGVSPDSGGDANANESADAPLLNGAAEPLVAGQNGAGREGGEGEGDKPASEPGDLADLVPENGEYDIKLDGGIELDRALLERASPVMKELGLTNGQASRLAGVIAEQRKLEYDALSERHQKITSDWQQEIRADRDFGGDNLATSLNNANRVIATFGDDALRRDLVEIGIGNHPGLFRLLARVGNALSDDKPASSETAAAPPTSPEQAMYGATTSTTRG